MKKWMMAMAAALVLVSCQKSEIINTCDMAIDAAAPVKEVQGTFTFAPLKAFPEKKKTVWDDLPDKSNRAAWDRREARLIHRYRLPLKREGDCLVFKEGAQRFCNNNSDSGDFKHFHLIGFDRETGFMHVYAFLYEGFSAYLVHKDSGELINVYNKAVLSPDKKYYASAYADLEAGYNSTGLQILRVEKDSLVPVFDRHITGKNEGILTGPSEILWTGKNSLALRLLHVSISGNGDDKYSACRLDFTP